MNGNNKVSSSTQLKVLMAFSLYAFSVAASAMPFLEFNPTAPFSVSPGTILVDVNVSGLDGEIVSAYDLDVSYDTNVLSFNNVGFDTLLGDEFFFEVLNSDTGLNSAPGLIDFAAISLLSDAELEALQAPNESIRLVTLEFDVLQTTITNLEFIFGPSKDVKCSNNVPCIVDNSEPIPTPLPATLWLLGCGFLANILLVRQRAQFSEVAKYSAVS